MNITKCIATFTFIILFLYLPPSLLSAKATGTLIQEFLSTAKNNPSSLEEIYNQGTNDQQTELINAQDHDGNTALILAASYNYPKEQGSIKIVQWLIAQGADVNKQNITGTSALMKAAQQGNPYIVKILQTNGADIARRNNMNQDALYYAILSANVNTISDLLQAGAATWINNPINNQSYLQVALTETPNGENNKNIAKKIMICRLLIIHGAQSGGDLPFSLFNTIFNSLTPEQKNNPQFNNTFINAQILALSAFEVVDTLNASQPIAQLLESYHLAPISQTLTSNYFDQGQILPQNLTDIIKDYAYPFSRLSQD